MNRVTYGHLLEEENERVLVGLEELVHRLHETLLPAKLDAVGQVLEHLGDEHARTTLGRIRRRYLAGKT